MQHCTYCYSSEDALWQMDSGQTRLCSKCIVAVIVFNQNGWSLYKRRILGSWRRLVAWIKKKMKMVDID